MSRSSSFSGFVYRCNEIVENPFDNVKEVIYCERLYQSFECTTWSGETSGKHKRWTCRGGFLTGKASKFFIQKRLIQGPYLINLLESKPWVLILILLDVWNLQFLHLSEYLKGITMYEEILKAYSSYAPDVDSDSRAEL